jgi:hypothetical protein
MSDLVILGATIVSGIFTMIALVFMNWNKFKYKELKQKHEIELLKEKDKINNRRFNRKQKALEVQTSNENPGILGQIGGLSKWLPILKSLDQDQLSDLIDVFKGEAGEEYEEGGLEGLVSKLPPEALDNLIKGFVDGLNKGKNKPGGGSFGQSQ